MSKIAQFTAAVALLVLMAATTSAQTHTPLYDGTSVSGEKFIFADIMTQRFDPEGCEGDFIILSGEQFPPLESLAFKTTMKAVDEVVNRNWTHYDVTARLNGNRTILTVRYANNHSYFPVEKIVPELEKLLKAHIVHVSRKYELGDSNFGAFWKGPWKLYPSLDGKGYRWMISSTISDSFRADLYEGKMKDRDRLWLNLTRFDSRRGIPVQYISIVMGPDGTPQLEAIRWYYNSCGCGPNTPYWPPTDWWTKELDRYIGDLPVAVRKYFSTPVRRAIVAAAVRQRR